MDDTSWRKQAPELQSTASYFGLQTPSFDSRKRSRPLLPKYSNHFISIVIRFCTKHKIIRYGWGRRQPLSSGSWFSPFRFHPGDWINWMIFLWFLFSTCILVNIPPIRHITSVYISLNLRFTNCSHTWHEPTVTHDMSLLQHSMCYWQPCYVGRKWNILWFEIWGSKCCQQRWVFCGVTLCSLIEW